MALFDDFTPPQQSKPGGLFDDFKPPAAAAPPPPSAAPANLGTTPIWAKPSNVGWGDYMLAHLGQAVSPIAQTDLSLHKTANEAALVGHGLTAGASGFIPGVNDYTQRAAAEEGPQATMGLEGAGYLLGPGKLGIAGKIGDFIAPASKLGRWAAGVAGSGVEGAGVGVLSAAASGDNIASGAGHGLFWGALGGVPGGVVGRGEALPPAASASDVMNQAKNIYAPLSNILYDSKNTVNPAIDLTAAQKSLKDWSGLKWKDAPSTQVEIKTLGAAPQVSANDIQQTMQALGKIKGKATATNNDKNFAAYFHDKLQGVLDNELPQTGVPANLPNATYNGAPITPSNYAGYVKSLGDPVFGAARELQRMDKMQARSEVTGGPSLSSQATSYLTSDKARNYGVTAGTPLYDAYNTLAGAGGSSESIPWYVKHFMLYPAVGVLGSEAYQAATGEHEGPVGHLLTDLAAGGTMMGGSALYGRYRAAQNLAAQQGALAAARVTAANRPPVAQAPVLPPAPPAPALDMLRSLMLGRAAGQ